LILPRHPPAANTVTGDTFGFPRNTPTSSGGEGSWVHCGAVPAALCHRSRGVPGASGGHAAGGTERDRSCFQKKVKPAALAAGASISCCESRCRDSGAHAATSNGWSVCLENKARISIGRFRWLRAPATICGRPLYCKGRSFLARILGSVLSCVRPVCVARRPLAMMKSAGPSLQSKKRSCASMVAGEVSGSRVTTHLRAHQLKRPCNQPWCSVSRPEPACLCICMTPVGP